MVDRKKEWQGKPDEEIDWTHELSGEVSGLQFQYKLPKEPEVVGRMTTAAVYKLLSGREVSDGEEDRFIEGSSTIKDEETEQVARGLFDAVRDILSESNGYQFEEEEAKKQGDRAKKAIEENSQYGITASYDYWQLRPVKSSISVDPDKNDPSSVTLRAPLSEVAAVKGKPSQLLSRELNAKKLQETGNHPLNFLGKVAQKLGVKTEEVVQEMFDQEQPMAFVRAMNDAGHTNFDKSRSTIVDVSNGRIQLPTDKQFKLLSPKEREIAQQPREERLHAHIQKPIQVGNTTADLSVSYWTEGQVQFNPQKMQMEGEIKPTEDDVFFASVRPNITLETTHEELLEIRKKAEEITDELGFPKPFKWF